MDTAESRKLRQEILDDVGAILRDELAARAWGRVLVEVVRGPDGAPIVAGIDVEEVVGDEALVDEVFGGERAHAVVPVLAKAVEALCAIDGVELEDVRGGTFVRRPDDTFAWLAALVHAPSLRLDRERDGLVARLRSKNDSLGERFGFPGGGRVAVDLNAQALDFVATAGGGASPPPKLRARATLIGTFAPASRTWGWGASNPHAPEAVRRESARLIDDVVDRDMWELSTPVFATDEGTAWAIAAFVCDRAGGDGVLCRPENEGLVFILLRDAALAPTS
jgi:hypothetical protein